MSVGEPDAGSRRKKTCADPLEKSCARTETLCLGSDPKANVTVVDEPPVTGEVPTAVMSSRGTAFGNATRNEPTETIPVLGENANEMAPLLIVSTRIRPAPPVEAKLPPETSR